MSVKSPTPHLPQEEIDALKKYLEVETQKLFGDIKKEATVFSIQAKRDQDKAFHDFITKVENREDYFQNKMMVYFIGFISFVVTLQIIQWYIINFR